MKACPTGCGSQVRTGHLMCGPCWAEVPRHLQRDVNATWRALLRTRGSARRNGKSAALEAYRTARDAALGSIR